MPDLDKRGENEDKKKKKNVYSLDSFYTLCIGLTIFSLVVIFMLDIIVFVFADSLAATIIALGAMLGLFILKSLYYVDARIPNKAMPMIFGRFVNKLIGPGYIFIPFPFKSTLILDFVFMYGGEVERIFPVEEVVPNGKATVVLPNDFYVSIDPSNPAQIVEVGGFEAALVRLENLTTQRERHWITSPNEGPQSMDQAREMGDEAIQAILEGLLKDDLRRIPSEIPTEVLIGIYKHQMLSPMEIEWQGASQKQKDWKQKYDGLAVEEKEKLMKETAEHLNFIQEARDGKRPVVLNYLGLIVRRFAVDNIEPAGTTIAQVAKVAEATFRKEQRKIDADGIAAAAKVLADIPGFGGDPVRSVMIAEKLVKEKVNINRLEASPEVLDVLGTFIKPLADMIAKKLGGKE